jgi:hypothetical protein
MGLLSCALLSDALSKADSLQVVSKGSLTLSCVLCPRFHVIPGALQALDPEMRPWAIRLAR